VLLEGCLLQEPGDPEEAREVHWELTAVYMELLELKQRKFERTAGNLDPRLLQKMVRR
jgi:hypothetical protein